MPRRFLISIRMPDESMTLTEYHRVGVCRQCYNLLGGGFQFLLSFNSFGILSRITILSSIV